MTNEPPWDPDVDGWVRPMDLARKPRGEALAYIAYVVDLHAQRERGDLW